MNPALLLQLLGLIQAAHAVRRFEGALQRASLVGQHQAEATDGMDLRPKPRPLVVNRAEVPLVVYLERGFLFNMQVIEPGEAVMLWSNEATGPAYMPFSIVAVVGDEKSLPTSMDSMLNFVGMSAVPTAFIVGTIISVASWGALTGPSVALAPLVSKVPAFAGYTLGAVDIAAGMAAAKGADEIAKRIVKEHPKMFMAKKHHVFPGEKYFEIIGGPSGGNSTDLKIKAITYLDYKGYNITTEKVCQNLVSQGWVNDSAFSITNCGDPRLIGEWRQTRRAHKRPKYELVGHDSKKPKLSIEWSKKNQKWRAGFVDKTLFGHERTVLYESAVNSWSVPVYGWENVAAGLPVPDIQTMMASESNEDQNAESTAET